MKQKRNYNWIIKIFTTEQLWKAHILKLVRWTEAVHRENFIALKLDQNKKTECNELNIQSESFKRE